jgi:penicillin-binding protein 1A
VFANHGFLIRPKFITKIVDRDGSTIEKAATSPERAIDKTTAYIMTSMLESVVKEGTGWRAKALGRPVAGKTGTTDDFHDAWFVGYTPQYITGVWVDFDQEGSLGKGETGSRAASPIWLDFMKEALKDKPSMVFQIPNGIVFSKIDTETGLRATAASKKTKFECFKEGTEPTHIARFPDENQEQEQFFKSTM